MKLLQLSELLVTGEMFCLLKCDMFSAQSILFIVKIKCQWAIPSSMSYSELPMLPPPGCFYVNLLPKQMPWLPSKSDQCTFILVKGLGVLFSCTMRLPCSSKEILGIQWVLPAKVTIRVIIFFSAFLRYAYMDLIVAP